MCVCVLCECAWADADALLVRVQWGFMNALRFIIISARRYVTPRQHVCTCAAIIRGPCYANRSAVCARHCEYRERLCVLARLF